MSIIKDINLAPSGDMKIKWASYHMPLLKEIYDEFSKTKPFKGQRIALSVHLEAKTAFLCLAMQAGGAKMYVTGSNPLSTQDDVAAACVKAGMEVFAIHGCTIEEYDNNLRKVLSFSPNIIIDDGGDLVHLMHTEFQDLIPNVIGGCEETTTGIHRLKEMNDSGKLLFPMIMVNEANCKHMFDNRYGTGQSVLDGIIRTTNLIIAGKYFVVSGYGWCGKGVSMRAKGMGAKVIVTETDPVRALEAHMDGFEVMSMSEAAKVGDVFCTVTGFDGIITTEHMLLMKDGAIVTNAGHFDVEVDMAGLREIATNVYEARNNIKGYVLPNGKTIFVIADGRLVNLAAGDGHPAEIMDMSFAIQALSAKFLIDNKGKYINHLVAVPNEIDTEVAKRKLDSLGISIDS